MHGDNACNADCWRSPLRLHLLVQIKWLASRHHFRLNGAKVILKPTCSNLRHAITEVCSTETVFQYCLLNLLAL